MRHENAAAIVAAAGNWHKATYSGVQNGCVEVGSVSGVVGVRDTKLGVSSPVLAFGAAEWAAFVGAVKSGEFG